jgi:hypothetical protein
MEPLCSRVALFSNVPVYDQKKWKRRLEQFPNPFTSTDIQALETIGG